MKENQQNTHLLMVSIRCAVYNHEPYLRQCLDGFIMQKTSFRFEAIVHDDASTDGSADIIREYSDKYPDIIKPIYEIENQYSKHDGSLQKVLSEACTGKYIAMCEGDDYWTDPLKLQKQVDYLEAHPECTICFAKVKVVSSGGDYLGWNIPVNSKIQAGVINLKTFIHEQYGKRKWVFQTSSYLYRSELVDGLYKCLKNELKDYPYVDIPIILYCLMQGDGYFLSDFMSCYRWHSVGSWSVKVSTDISFSMDVSKKLIKGLNSLDKITSYKYHKDIIKKIRQQEYEIDVLSNNILHLLHPKYWCLYSEGGLKNTISIIAKYYFPNVHTFIKAKLK